MVSDEAPPADPAEMLRLIETERSAAERSMRPNPLVMYVPWGVAWFVGFGLCFLREGPDGRVFVAMPSWLPLTALFVLMAVALVITAWVGVRAGRHVRGESSIRGMQYGLSWFAAFAAVAVIASRFSDSLPEPEVGLLWSALSVAAVAVMYMTGAAIWQTWDMFVLGAWMTVTNIAGVLAGPGWHYLVICLAGGGGLLVGGLVGWLHWRPRALADHV